MPERATGGKKARASRLAEQLIVRPGTRPRLRDHDADRAFGWKEAEARSALKANRKRLEELQFKLYADGRFPVLIVLQGIDGAGKDGAIRDVITAFNPQGCTVTPFKAPTAAELEHDYLWRIHKHVPARGEIGVFNRSHYEDVLVARVDALVPRAVWKRRYAEINRFEQLLATNGTRIVKLFLHISSREQKQRFIDRVHDRRKQWKFDPADLEKRKQWKAYRQAFEAAVARCSTAWAPWHVIPADREWFRNLAISQILVQELEKLPLRYPRPAFDPAKIRIR
jgi:PPK2 family polyphosphate:nucleotide phosphotransferase